MALREKPDLDKEKLTWLQRHDQDCGSLYGVLPLCLAMPVAAADHLDRGRGILRGCAGEIVGWVWPADAVGGASQEATQIWNELPACIMVRFKTKTTWRVQGIDEDNVFPVAPQKKPWYLDKGRRRPVLRVTRKQFPLAPGFATTAHAAQGQTCKEGVVMDMHIGETGDPLTAYIALTHINACPRQAWFVCVQTLPCSTGKKARAIADVWAAIAERKRKREQESPQTQEEGPKAKQRRQENGTELTTEGPADVRGTQEDRNRTEKATLPTKEARATEKGKSFQYVCPHCDQSVTSTIDAQAK